MAETDQITSRPASWRDLVTLIDALNKKGVPYMLVGGYSMILHGFSRGTRDIDILLPAKESVGKDLVSVLLLLGEESAKDIDPKWFEEGENIRFSNSYVLDIMLNANGQTYESLLPFKREVEVDGLTINIPSIEGMIKTKMTTREKDAIDRLFLERALRNEAPQPHRKSGSSIFERLIEFVKARRLNANNNNESEISKISQNEGSNPRHREKPKG